MSIKPTSNRKHHYEAIKLLLMDLLKAGGGLSILMARPSGSIYHPKYFFKNGEFDVVKFRRAVRYGKQQGYLSVKERAGEMTLTLSGLGHGKALRYSLEDIHIAEPLAWDKKWRLVFFDIPEDMRPIRKIFKSKLDELGFAQIQKSVYAHPYPCHNEIEYIRSLYSLEGYIRLGVLDKLEGEEVLKERFGL